MQSEELAPLTAQISEMFVPIFRQQHRVTLTAAALQGLIVRADYQAVHPDTIASHAVALADATLMRLEQQHEKQ
jgi:hypothetical protein